MSNDKLKTPEDLRHSTAVMTEANADRPNALEDLFENFDASAAADKALINQNFSADERRPAHSPLLQKKAEDLRETRTLTDLVRGILK